MSAANAPLGAPARLGATYGIDANGNIFDPLNPLNPNIPYTGPLNDSSGFRLNPPTNGIQSLGYNDFENNFLQLPLERYSVFSNADFALTDNISLFGEMRFSQVYASAQGFTSGVFNVWSPTIPYNPQYDDPDSPDFGNGPAGFAHHPVSSALADLLNARPDNDEPWIYVGGLDYLENFETQTTTNLYQVVGGPEGEARVNDRDWYWNAFASHGKTTVNAHQPEGFPYLPRLQNLFNADHYGRDFDISSLPGFFPLAVTGHCTSGLPIFDENGDPNNTPFVSKDCSDYVVLRMNSVTTLTQDIVEATVSGGLADLPAGEVLFALGIGSREEEFAFDPDSGFNANQDFPNVVQNIILPVTVDGTTDVKEIFGEIAIPLVSDRRSFSRSKSYPASASRSTARSGPRKRTSSCSTGT
ncbi:MAG TPA: hypothetical protein VMR74_05320 [Gammaproteobacteria bacterium]|nr:hypothetical protein [Gammaproteobacteria bacterium]